MYAKESFRNTKGTIVQSVANLRADLLGAVMETTVRCVWETPSSYLKSGSESASTHHCYRKNF